MDESAAPPNPLSALIQTTCERLDLPLLPAYLPGIFAAFALYQSIYAVVGPWISTRCFPKVYPQLRGKEKLRWDENIVSFIQAIILCVLAARVILFDQERQRLDWQGRVWGHTEPTAEVLTVANGYFYWHLMMMLWHWRIFGLPMVAHALAVSFLMTNGYRPAFMTYSPPSFLYEFSTIFLDIQSTLRSLNMEGTPIQIANGVAFLISFFLSRVFYGTYLQTWFYVDIWRAFVATEADIPFGHDRIPTWLLAGHALSAVVLQVLNYMWFYKIARTVYRKLFVKKLAKD